MTVVGRPSSPGLNRKNSASIPAFITYPRSAAAASCRLSTVRGSPAKGVPSGIVTSQMRRATRADGSPHGNSWNVARSGLRSMSDSSTRTNPAMLEPSNMRSPCSALRNCEAGTSTFLITPRMSVNCRRRKRTWCASASARMSAGVAPVREAGRSGRLGEGTGGTGAGKPGGAPRHWWGGAPEL